MEQKNNIKINSMTYWKIEQMIKTTKTCILLDESMKHIEKFRICTHKFNRRVEVQNKGHVFAIKNNKSV